VRRILFTAPVAAAILANHRRISPFGLDGGGHGLTGNNRIVRADGREDALPGTATMRLAAGDSVVIETPGGGGFGEAPKAGAGSSDDRG
jgi:5-oxoprolinase (ATP-hydrolysing)